MTIASAARRLGARPLGVGLAAATAVVSGCAVFVNGYGVRAWGDVGGATTYTTFKNLVAATVIISIGTMAARRPGRGGLVRPRRAGQWLGLAVIAVVGGSVPFALFFEGLARAGSTQAAFLHKTLVIWVAALAVLLLRERVGPAHVVAIGLLVGGQMALSGGLSDLGFGMGELMILAATLLWSLEVILAKRLLPALSPLTLGIARMAGGTALLMAYGLVTGGLASLGSISAAHVGWVLFTGAVLSLYVIGWYTSLALAPAVDVTAVLVGGAIITAALRAGIQGVAVPSIAGLGLLGCGVALVMAAAVRRGPVRA